VGAAEAEASTVAGAGAVVGVVDKRTNRRSERYEHTIGLSSSLKISLIASIIVAFALFFGVSRAASEEKSDTAAKTESKKQKEFSSPKEAADTLVRAAEAFDVAALEEILGPDAADLIKSADPVADKKRATDFAAKSKEKMSLDIDPKNSNRTILSVGNDAFPWLFPLYSANESGCSIPRRVEMKC
jgi:hypothetical protein